MKKLIQQLKETAAKGEKIEAKEAQLLVTLIKHLFDKLMVDAGYPERDVRRLTTKFRDAGRRSAPWKPASSKVPGRPQDGMNGNRINRWLLPKDHKFYADEVTACLVEVKYYLLALSMKNAPVLPDEDLKESFVWLSGQKVEPGSYLDPIQLIPIDLKEVIQNARMIQSGHICPLDRGGVHEPNNACLMLARSNQLQGNLTVKELLELMIQVVERHRSTGSRFLPPK